MRLEKIGIDRLNEMNKLGAIAFTYSIDDPDPERDANDPKLQAILQSGERWGMVDEKTGKLMGGMILLDYHARIGDKWLPLCGIGGVATLPEYRREGVIRNVFSQALPAMYKRGVALTGLYPFSHAFYRKFGYEVFGGKNIATINLDQLRAFPAPDEARMIATEQDMLLARVIYERFAEKRDISMRREMDSQWKSVMGGDPYKERIYKYLLLRNGANGAEPCAYVSFTPDEAGQTGRVANAREAAYVDADGFRRVLGFMATFYPHYRALRLALPGDVNLAALSVNPYEVSDVIDHGYMLRAINAQALLESQPLSPALKLAVLNKPLKFSLLLHDEMIPQNAGRYELTLTPEGVKCERVDALTWDIEMDITTFTQLTTGSLSLRQAEYRADLKLAGPCPAAEALFTGRPQYIVDHY